MCVYCLGLSSQGEGPGRKSSTLSALTKPNVPVVSGGKNNSLALASLTGQGKRQLFISARVLRLLHSCSCVCCSAYFVCKKCMSCEHFFWYMQNLNSYEIGCGTNMKLFMKEIFLICSTWTCISNNVPWVFGNRFPFNVEMGVSLELRFLDFCFAIMEIHVQELGYGDGGGRGRGHW